MGEKIVHLDELIELMLVFDLGDAVEEEGGVFLSGEVGGGVGGVGGVEGGGE